MNKTIYNNDVKIYSSQSESIKENLDLNNVRENFDNSAKWYTCFFKDILPERRDIKILDIPCGHGNILYFLKEKGYSNVHGYDIDEGRIDIAISLGLNGQLADGLKIIQNAEDVDVVFSLDFLEHLEKEDAINYLADCYNALTKTGRLIIRMPVSDNLMGTYHLYNDFTHKWTANSEVISSLIKMVGFQKVIIKDERPVLYKWSNYFRYIIFCILTKLHNLYLTLLGFPPLKIWSPSCYFVAFK